MIGKAGLIVRRFAGLLAGAALVLPLATVAQAAQETPSYTRAEAETQLRQAVTSLSVSDPEASHPTLALRDLALALPALEGAERRRAKAILARPPADDAGFEPFGAEWPGSATEETAETDDFIVHWPDVPGCAAPAQGCDEPDPADTSPANSIPDYIDEVIQATDDSILVENDELGWPDYKPDGTEGGNAKLDIYVADICNENGGVCIFGYANPDDNGSACTGAPFKCSAYLVLDNDYNEDEFGYPDPGVPLRVTTAHEYNHMLQFNLDTAQDTWMLESTATWAEEQVFPADDDWVQSYMATWAQSSRDPLTDPNGGGGLRFYGSAVWNHWLESGDGGYGADVILDAWEVSRDTDPKDYGVGAYREAIRQNGGNGFSREFVPFAAATSEWRTGDGSFPDGPELTDVTRNGTLTLGKRPVKTVLDNTSYQLLDVNPKNADDIELMVKSDRAVRWGIALVGRDGTLLGGTVDRNSVNFPKGGKGVIELMNAQDYERITAVVVNADGRVQGDKPIFGEFGYAKNNKEFRLKLR